MSGATGAAPLPATHEYYVLIETLGSDPAVTANGLPPC